MPLELGIIGGGRAAWAFGSAWKQIGWPLRGISLRPGSPSDVPRLLDLPLLPLPDLARSSAAVLVAVSDPAIEEVAKAILPHLSTAALVFHASGSLSSDVFRDAPGRFSLHPFRALPAPGTPVSFRDTLLVFEGTAEAHRLAVEFSHDSGAVLATIDPASKELYHAGAVFASNFVAALLDIAASIEQEAGIDSAAMRPAIARLASSAIENWEAQATAQRFTGPVARRDGAMVHAHLGALAEAPDTAQLYRLMSLAIARSLLRDSPDDERLAALARHLSTPHSVP